MAEASGDVGSSAAAEIIIRRCGARLSDCFRQAESARKEAKEAKSELKVARDELEVSRGGQAASDEGCLLLCFCKNLNKVVL